MTIATNVITLALSVSGVLGQGQTPQPQDLTDSLTLLNDTITQWQQQRVVAVIPGTLATFPDLTTDVPSWDGNENVLVWNLAARLRPLYGLPEDEQQTKLAVNGATILQANNKQSQPANVATTTDLTGQGLVLLALRAAGRINDQQGVIPGSVDALEGFFLLQEMLDEWQQDRNITVTPGAIPVLNGALDVFTPTPGIRSAIIWNLAVRLRSAFGMDESKDQTERAARALASFQANNKQAQPYSMVTSNDGTAQGLVFLALRAAGRINDNQGVVPGSQDESDAFYLLLEMLDEWQQDRNVTVTPGLLPVLSSLSDAVVISPGLRAAIVWGLAVRLRSAFGLEESKEQVDRAQKALAAFQANNKQQQPSARPGGTSTARKAILLALRMAGRINDIQSVSDTSQDMDDGLSLLNNMGAQWSKERWLVYDLKDLAVLANGSTTYTVGPGGDFDIPRADRIDSAFVRMGVLLPGLVIPGIVTAGYTIPGGQVIAQTPGDFSATDFSSDFDIGSPQVIGPPTIVPSSVGPSTQLPPTAMNPLNAIDYPLEILQSREDYNLIALKSLHTFPSALFFDSDYPLGTIYLYPTPVAQQFEIHISVKATLPVYMTLDTMLALPPEYQEAVVANLACRIVALNGGSPSQYLLGLARKALATIRGANVQIPMLQMPAGMPGSRWGAGGFAFGGYGAFLPTGTGGGGTLGGGGTTLSPPATISTDASGDIANDGGDVLVADSSAGAAGQTVNAPLVDAAGAQVATDDGIVLVAG